MARKFGRGAEAKVYGTDEVVWITPILGYEIDSEDVDKTPAAFIQRHALKSEQGEPLFSSAEEVAVELDMKQIGELVGVIFELSGLGKPLEDSTATFPDGEGEAGGADPASTG